jgi:SAM-dependent methyltransferase
MVSPSDADGAQDVLSVEKNKAFFAENEAYARNVTNLTTYRNIRRVIDEEIAGRERLLDIGNGGVFDYDTGLVPEIVGVDLFLDETDHRGLPSNVTLRRGDALSLDDPDASFDGVLFVLVLHHLVSTDVAGSVANIRQAVGEARRVLEPGGRLIIVESCVSPRAFAVERRLFSVLRALASTRFMRHPPTLQLPPGVIESLLREHFADVHAKPIPIGRIVMQFGRRWPTALTPARPYVFTAS